MEKISSQQADGMPGLKPLLSHFIIMTLVASSDNHQQAFNQCKADIGANVRLHVPVSYQLCATHITAIQADTGTVEFLTKKGNTDIYNDTNVTNHT